MKKSINVKGIVKCMAILLVMVCCVLSFAGKGYAGSFVQGDEGVWFQYDDGSYPKNTTLKIGHENYTFDESGWLVMNKYVSGNYMKNERVQSLTQLATYDYGNFTIGNGFMDAVDIAAYKFDDRFIHTVEEAGDGYIAGRTTAGSVTQEGSHISEVHAGDGNVSIRDYINKSSIEEYEDIQTIITDDFMAEKEVNAFSGRESTSRNWFEIN